MKIDRNGNGNDKAVLDNLKSLGKKRKVVRVDIPRGYVLTTNPERWRGYIPEFSYGKDNLSF